MTIEHINGTRQHIADVRHRLFVNHRCGMATSRPAMVWKIPDGIPSNVVFRLEYPRPDTICAAKVERPPRGTLLHR